MEDHNNVSVKKQEARTRTRTRKASKKYAIDAPTSFQIHGRLYSQTIYIIIIIIIYNNGIQWQESKLELDRSLPFSLAFIQQSIRQSLKWLNANTHRHKMGIMFIAWMWRWSNWRQWINNWQINGKQIFLFYSQNVYVLIGSGDWGCDLTILFPFCSIFINILNR